MPTHSLEVLLGEMRPAERVRLRKVLVTEEVEQTIPRRREVIQLETQPPPAGTIESVEDLDVDPGDPNQEVSLHDLHGVARGPHAPYSRAREALGRTGSIVASEMVGNQRCRVRDFRFVTGAPPEGSCTNQWSGGWSVMSIASIRRGRTRSHSTWPRSARRSQAIAPATAAGRRSEPGPRPRGGAASGAPGRDAATPR